MDRKRLLIACLTVLLMLGGCSGTSPASDGGHKNGSSSDGPIRDNTPKVYSPSADGTVTFQDDTGTFFIDASHTDQGYIMVKYAGQKDNEKLQIGSPDGATYTYTLTPGDFYAYPFSAGDGSYSVKLFDNVSGNDYSTAYATDITVKLENEFLPFLYSNRYASFSPDDECVAKACELAKNAHSDLEVVAAIYDYITDNITYDHQKAKTVSANYLPTPDNTLSTKTGICFDYASLMTAMLRSQEIPTKLVIGYWGEIYHAWISTYVDDQGWVDNIIEFDGKQWKLMDPTNAAVDNTVDYETGGPDPYTVKYSY